MIYLTILGETFWFAVLELKRLPRVITLDAILTLVVVILIVLVIVNLFLLLRFDL